MIQNCAERSALHGHLSRALLAQTEAVASHRSGWAPQAIIAVNGKIWIPVRGLLAGVE